MAKLRRNILGSTLYREPKLDCGISLNVSSLRLNMAPRWSLGRQMMVGAELKMATAALGDREGMAVLSVVGLTLYERTQKHLVLDPEGFACTKCMPPSLPKQTPEEAGGLRFCQTAEKHAICSVCLVMITDFYRACQNFCTACQSSPGSSCICYSLPLYLF